MKKSKCIVMNMKDEYNRCCVPYIPMGDRRWPEGDDKIPDYAKTNVTPRLKSDNNNKYSNIVNDMIETRHKLLRQKKISYTKKIVKKEIYKNKIYNRKYTYVKKIRNERKYARSTDESM